MTVFAMFDFMDAVIKTFSESPLLKDVQIFDGPEINGDYSEKAIAVGHDGIDFGEVTAATASNSYKPISPERHMDELGFLDCTIYVNSGDSELGENRRSAKAILSAVDTIIRADPSFGTVIRRAGLAQSTLKYDQTKQGNGVKVVFTINYTART